MANISKKKFAKLLHTKTSLTCKDCELIYDSFCDIIKKALLTGNDVQLVGIGKFGNAVVKEKGERIGMVNVRTGEKGVLPPIPTYNRPYFRFSGPLKQEMKVETLDNLF